MYVLIHVVTRAAPLQNSIAPKCFKFLNPKRKTTRNKKITEMSPKKIQALFTCLRVCHRHFPYFLDRFQTQPNIVSPLRICRQRHARSGLESLPQRLNRDCQQRWYAVLIGWPLTIKKNPKGKVASDLFPQPQGFLFKAKGSSSKRTGIKCQLIIVTHTQGAR